MIGILLPVLGKHTKENLLSDVTLEEWKFMATDTTKAIQSGNSKSYKGRRNRGKVAENRKTETKMVVMNKFTVNEDLITDNLFELVICLSCKETCQIKYELDSITLKSLSRILVAPGNSATVKSALHWAHVTELISGSGALTRVVVVVVVAATVAAAAAGLGGGGFLVRIEGDFLTTGSDTK